MTNLTAEQHAAELAILAAAGAATEPQPRDDLSKAAGRGWAIRKTAIAALLDRGVLVEVRCKAPRSRAWRVWTPERARTAGLEIIGTTAPATTVGEASPEQPGGESAADGEPTTADRGPAGPAQLVAEASDTLLASEDSYAIYSWGDT